MSGYNPAQNEDRLNFNKSMKKLKITVIDDASSLTRRWRIPNDLNVRPRVGRGTDAR